HGGRASVLECGSPVPLSERRGGQSKLSPLRRSGAFLKAPQGRRTPKPDGSSGAHGGRASVLECGSPVPLSERRGGQSKLSPLRRSRAFLKAPQGRRTPKPDGSPGAHGGRASVLECGSPVPLSERRGGESKLSHSEGRDRF